MIRFLLRKLLRAIFKKRMRVMTYIDLSKPKIKR